MRAVMNSKQVLVAMAVVVLAVVVAPVAIAGAEGASQSAAPGGKAIKQLKKQVRTLQQQIASLQGQIGGSRTPSGPAGGDLTGTFPNPLIGPNTVGAAEIQTNAVAGQEIADDSVSAQDIKTGAVEAGEIATFAVGTEEIYDGEVTAADMGNLSVGAHALKSVIAVVGPGVTVTAGTPKVTSVTCPEDRQLIAGGFAWTDKDESTILASAPSDVSPSMTWTVEGMVDSGSNGLYAWASCLAN